MLLAEKPFSSLGINIGNLIVGDKMFEPTFFREFLKLNTSWFIYYYTLYKISYWETFRLEDVFTFVFRNRLIVKEIGSPSRTAFRTEADWWFLSDEEATLSDWHRRRDKDLTLSRQKSVDSGLMTLNFRCRYCQHKRITEWDTHTAKTDGGYRSE